MSTPEEQAVFRLHDKIEGLETDLFEAVRVAYSRGAVEWTRLNYPAWYERLKVGGGQPVIAPREGWENWSAQKIAAAWYDGFVNAKKNDDWEDMYDWAALTGQAYAIDAVEHRNPPQPEGEKP